MSSDTSTTTDFIPVELVSIPAYHEYRYLSVLNCVKYRAGISILSDQVWFMCTHNDNRTNI